MIINSIPGANIATAVWQNATRNLTGFGSGALVQTASLNNSLAASTSVSLTCVAGAFQITQVFAKLGAITAQTNFNYADGTNTFLIQACSTANKDYNQIFYIQGGTAHGQIQNTDGALAIIYSFVTLRFVQ